MESLTISRAAGHEWYFPTPGRADSGTRRRPQCCAISSVLLALAVVVPLHGEQEVEQSAIVGLAEYVERSSMRSRSRSGGTYFQESEWPRRKRTLRSDFIASAIQARALVHVPRGA